MSDLDEMLRLAGSAVDEAQTIESHRPVVYLGGYDFGADAAAAKLSRQAYDGLWSIDDLGWDAEISPDVIVPEIVVPEKVPRFHPGKSWSREKWQDFEIANLRYLMSQLLHGEQMSFTIAGSLCTSGTSWDVKTFGGWLAVDEARHAEAISRYLERIGGAYPLSQQYFEIIETSLGADAWDKVFIVSQVLLEGVALGVISHVLETARDPLLREMLRLVQRDEARHVAFGSVELGNILKDMTAAEILERQQIVSYCTRTVLDKLIPVQVADEYGIDARQFTRAVRMSPSHLDFQRRLFAHVTPLCAKLGLLDANNGVLRREFELLGLVDGPGDRKA